MIKTDEGTYTHNGWVITVWQGQTVGMWEYRASRGKEHLRDFVQAWDEQSAAAMVALELQEA